MSENEKKKDNDRFSRITKALQSRWSEEDQLWEEAWMMMERRRIKNAVDEIESERNKGKDR